MPTYAVDGNDLYYEDLGSGPPVVLLHGAASSGADLFENVAPKLSPAYRVLIPDLRGMGQSARVTGDLAPATWITDVVALLDATGIEAAHVIGISLGSRVGARLAFDAPERVLSLVVDAPLIANDPAGNASLNANFGDIPEGSPAAERYRRMHGADWREVVASYFRVRNQADLQEYLGMRTRVASMQTPTLITRGDIDDTIHPIAHAIEWHSLQPSSWLWIAPNTASSAMNGRLAEFTSLYEEFIKQLS